MSHTPALRRGWTTGACAAAAAKAAYAAVLTGNFPDPVEITLPRGGQTHFALAEHTLAHGHATAGIVKDAGDDPDVTHGAQVRATVQIATPGSGVVFRAGPGVGTVTRAGLPLPPGEPAINPVPRRMIQAEIAETAAAFGGSGDVVVEISIPGGEVLAQKTLNERLGILGGLSILGTTGIVVPYSCSAWIHSIYRGIDVARAACITHIAGATGRTSEAAVQRTYGLSDQALIDMGDFVGGMLKYLRRNPVARISIAGGFAKISKLAKGSLDLHSARTQIDPDYLAFLASGAGAKPSVCEQIARSGSAMEILQIATASRIALADAVALAAWNTAAPLLAGTGSEMDVLIFDREGNLAGRSGVSAIHSAPPFTKPPVIT